MKYSRFFAVLLTFAVVMPASAQERGVARRLFTYLDTKVTVEVLADAPGTLQIVRGEPGQIDVAARVPGGVSAFALGGRSGDNLRLTALGGESAEFIVVVPEDVYLRVRLPNNKAAELASTRPAGTFTWAGTPAAGAEQSEPIALPMPSGPVIAHTAPRAPRVLNVSRLNAVRTITLRVQSGRFEVGGSRYMRVVNGNSENVEVRTGDESEDVIIGIPAETRDFTLKLGGRTALVVRGAEISTYCEPVTEQVLGGGRRWFTFAPEAGRLTCR
jgi:hypothetical protein